MEPTATPPPFERDSTAEFYAQRPHLRRCESPRADGFRCLMPARRTSPYCINHDPNYAEAQRRNTLKGVATSVAARKARAPYVDLSAFDLSTPAGVQAALDAVIRLELTGRIPTARSRNLIRALSIAVRNAHNFTGPVPREHYRQQRQAIDPILESLCREADERDALRIPPSPRHSQLVTRRSPTEGASR